jgi:hypothetical protein
VRLSSPAQADAGLDASTGRPAGPGGQAYTFSPSVPPVQVQVIKDVAQLPLALSGFLAVLAAGAVGHALAVAVRRRRRELAVLRALGLTRIQSRGWWPPTGAYLPSSALRLASRWAC